MESKARSACAIFLLHAVRFLCQMSVGFGSLGKGEESLGKWHDWPGRVLLGFNLEGYFLASTAPVAAILFIEPYF